ncbi:MAG: hypothetical protein AAGG02_13880, partial [Cyanobacteria bacterium P01_H01_bin.15]
MPGLIDKSTSATARNFRDYVRYLISRPSGPAKRFVIFGRGRSGSTLLVDLLGSLDSVCCDGEILHYRVYFPKLHIETQAAKAPATVYGFKLLSYQLGSVQGIANPADFLRSLEQAGYQFIYLQRRNLLRHALSNIVARQREQFHFRDSSQRTKHQIDVDEVLKWMKSSQRMRVKELSWLSGISYLELFYEDDLLDSDRHQATIDRVCSYLQIPSAPVKTNLRKA